MTVVLVTATAGLILAAPDAPLGNAWGFRGFSAILAIAFSAVGALISLRVPGNRIGLLLLAIGLSAAATGFVVEYAAFAIVVRPGAVPFGLAVAWLATWIWVPFAGVTTTFLPLLFPDGHLPSPRWRPAAVLAGITIVLTSVALSLYPGPIDNAPYVNNPVSVPVEWQPAVMAVSYLGFLALAASCILSATSMVLRFRGATGMARQQLKWFAAAAIFAGLTLAGPGTLLNIVLAGNPRAASLKIAEILTILSLMTIPAATGIAILRYHLYDIDRVLSRSIAWAVVSALLVALFVATVLLLQAVLAPLTAGSTLAVAASTLLVAAITQPIARRVQVAVDRRFFRARYDAARAGEGFAARLRSEVDLEAIRGDLAATVVETVRPTATHLWIRGGPS